ncbi:S41 family peptidase [Mucilaginibacter gracilis]|nr:S41 family peptidase [Mucilaginibacter gracilis]
MKFKNNLLIISLLAISINSFSQQLTSDSAYNQAQIARNDARKLWKKPGATKEEVTQAAEILNSAIDYLNSAPVRELSQGNLFLNARKQDVYADMARAYAIAGMNEQALTALEKRCGEGAFYGIDELEKDTIYKSLRTNARFVKVLAVLKNRMLLWKDNSLKTAYNANLSYEEKVAGLSLLWSNAKYNFANFDHAAIDWDKTYLDYLSLIKSTKSTSEYYRVLQTFYARLKDGHTNVYPPNELDKDFYSRPPIRTELIEGRVFITKVFSDSLKNAGIVPGLEILNINNIPVLSYAKEEVEPYQSSSTPQDLVIREFSYGLLLGPEKTPVTLVLKNAKGLVFTKALGRGKYRDAVSAQGIEYKEFGNIGYLTVNNFEDEKIMTRFDSLYTRIIKTKGLIIDIRNNGGGDSYIGYHIIASLVNKPFKSSAARIPRYISLPGVSSQWSFSSAGDIDPNGKQYYDKPVVVLIGARTFSAAEDFTVAFDYIKRGKLIGQATGGSTGQPISFNLPGGGSARVCGKHDTYPDGKEFVGIGIQPDIIVDKTIKDIMAGKDAELQKALEVLNK